QGLVVEHKRVRLPGFRQPGLLRREPWLVAGHPRHLARDKYRAIQQEAGLLLLNDLEPGAAERLAAGGGYLARIRSWYDDPSASPEVRVDDHWQVGPAERPGQAIQPG